MVPEGVIWIIKVTYCNRVKHQAGLSISERVDVLGTVPVEPAIESHRGGQLTSQGGSMIESILQEISNRGDKAAIVPINRLQDIRQDVLDLQAREALNDFQKYIVNHIYVLDVPDTDFEVCSILVVASPGPFLARITFNWQGKRVPLLLPASYTQEVSGPLRIERYLQDYLSPRGYHVRYAKLPKKLLAVRSGLGLYGRNNLCYVEGMGSSLLLATYLTDIPCAETSWYAIGHMEACQTCTACLENCPTAAITGDRFLIDNERCLTYFNESGGEHGFPEWISPSVHHTIYGCLRCQTVCPMNRDHIHTTIEPVEFTEEETALLVGGKPYERFSEALKQKIKKIDMENYLGVLPRNLQVLLAQRQH
jgi:epoxyqueuosine reductase